MKTGILRQMIVALLFTASASTQAYSPALPDNCHEATDGAGKAIDDAIATLKWANESKAEPAKVMPYLRESCNLMRHYRTFMTQYQCSAEDIGAVNSVLDELNRTAKSIGYSSC